MDTPSIIALKCFDTSARLLSFTKASEELNLTQGTISHHILLLEKLLGTPLFVRTKQGLALTQAGIIYQRGIVLSLRQIEKATLEIQSLIENNNTLNLSCSSSFANHWLMPRMYSFAAGNPEMTLNLSTRVGTIDFSVSNEEDASIEFSVGEENGLNAELIKTLELRLCMSKQLLQQLGFNVEKTLTEAELIDVLNSTALLRHGTIPEAWTGWLTKAGLSEHISATHLQESSKFSLLSMAMNAVQANLGVALLPRFMSAKAIQSGQLVELSDVSWIAPKAYYLRWPKTRPIPERLRLFIDWVKEQSRVDCE